MRGRGGENLGAISARDIFLVESFAGIAKRDQLAVEENHLIEKFRHRFQIVMRRNDEISDRDEFANRLGEQILRSFVEAGKRFIEQKNVGLLRERPREKGALLLPTGKRADLPRGQIGQLHRAQGEIDSRGVRFAETAPLADAHVTAHLHHPAHGDGKIPVDHAALRQIGDVSIRAHFSVTAENDLAGFLRD